MSACLQELCRNWNGDGRHCICERLGGVMDGFDPRLECGAWAKAPRVIGGPSHTHVCGLDPEHGWRGDDAEMHACHSCGHRW